MQRLSSTLGLLALSLLLAVGQAQTIVTTKGRSVSRLKLSPPKLAISHDLGELGYDWGIRLNITGGERLVCKYGGVVGGATQARAEVRATVKGPVLWRQQLGSVPALGKEKIFFVATKSLPKKPTCLVQVVYMNAQHKVVGKPSNFVSIKTVAPNVVTKFTDHGLRLSLSGMLKKIRKQFDVPALGGAIVTRHGVEIAGVEGIRRHGHATKAQITDRWHLGSDTKAMTAALVAIYVDRGKLRWDTTLSQALPGMGIHSSYRNVTIEQLLSHTAGVPGSYSDAQRAAYKATSGSIQLRRWNLTAAMLGAAPATTPGTKYKYANVNFIIVGTILERVSGCSWEAMMHSDLLGPLGMASAGFGAPGSPNALTEPFGHRDTSSGRKSYFSDNRPILGPAGTVHASLHDWARFIRLMMNGKEGKLSLSSAQLQRLRMAQPGFNYGHGWRFFSRSWTKGQALSHDGSNTMWYCRATVIPGRDFAVLTVCNIGGKVGGKDYGDGDKACTELQKQLINRHLEK